jgi:hypothetical protein
MAVSSGTITVGTTPVQVDGNSVQPSHIHIRNNDSTKTLFAGNSNVAIGNGLLIDKLTTVEFDIPPGDCIHLIAESGTVSVSWLKVSY